MAVPLITNLSLKDFSLRRLYFFQSIILYITAIEGERYLRSDRSESGIELALIRA